jgi:hypothetical protein
MKIPDKRRHRRTEAQFFTVIRRPLEGEEASLPQAGATRDISAGGLFFYTRSKVKESDDIALTIYPNGGWAERGILPKLEAEGTVLRVEHSHKTHLLDDLTGVAVRFTQELAIFL